VLRWRLLLGALFIAALAGLCWLDARQALGAPPGLWLFPLALLLALAASGEMLWMFAGRDIRPSAAVSRQQRRAALLAWLSAGLPT
jgi:hypothetical protein